jgi:hypothetical protein
LCSLHHQSSKELEVGGEKWQPKKRTWNEKAETGGQKVRPKSESAEWELESKLHPFYWLFLVVFLHVLSSLCLRRKRRR